MDNLSWSAKRRSTGSLGASGSRDATLSNTFSMGRADKELLVYRRRSVQEREASAARFREEEAADGLNQLGVFTYTTQVLPVPKSRPKGMIKLKKYKHQLREGGPTEVLPYYHGFKHVIDFPCIKQPAGSIKEAFYVLHHLKGFVEDAEMMSLPPKMTYYVVFEGRVPGVYEEWEECKKQVHKFSGNCYKGYPTRHEAVAKWRKHQANKSKMKTFLVLSLLLTTVAAVLYFILV
ncbi:hypothetical protein QYE76_063899 [Lolium multiflorum]|uniref:Ribonuclease H n=1 Tax=Lolium multiflorum TaxID=4521 RepID=A0AAD8S5U2_LOLMU|nr:hypothetical protein QYE76_063899 [Lolium multiflorum]